MKANKGSEPDKKVSLTEFQESLNIQVKILQNDVNYLKDFATGKLNKPSEKEEVTKFEFDLHKKMMIDLISKSATRDELDCYATKKALSEYLTSLDAKHRFIPTDQLETLITREELMGLSPMKNTAPPAESPQKIFRQATAQAISLLNTNDLSSENQFWKEEISRQVKDLTQEMNIIKYEKLGDDAHGSTIFGITNPLALESDMRNLKKRMRQFEIEYETVNRGLAKLSLDSKKHVGIVQKTLDEEIESLGLYKERVQIEVDVMKKRLITNIENQSKAAGVGRDPGGEGVQKTSVMMPGIDGSRLDVETEVFLKRVEKDNERTISLTTTQKLEFEQFRQETVGAIDLLDKELKKIKYDVDDNGSKKAVIVEGQDGAKYDIGRIAKQNNYLKRKLDEVTSEINNKISTLEYRVQAEQGTGNSKMITGHGRVGAIEDVDARIYQ
jgi:hypothetical protein